jgi:hypothetical protein
MIRRFSSRQVRLDHGFLRERLRGATSSSQTARRRGEPLPAGAAAGLLRHAGTIELHWSVEMRYQARSVTRVDLELVSASVDWLDRRYDILAR